MEVSFMPEKSLGFRYGNPLDGLNCYERYLEAFLLANNVCSKELAMGLFSPLDFRPAYIVNELDSLEKKWWHFYSRFFSQYDSFGAIKCRWFKSNYTINEIINLINNSPILMTVDSYFLPWHLDYKKKHIWVHVLMATGYQDGKLYLLDTDASKSENYSRTVTLDLQFIEAIVKIGIPEYKLNWRVNWEDYFLETLHKSREYLANDVPALRVLANEWQKDFQENFYSPFHSGLLIVVVPILFKCTQLLKNGPIICKMLPKQSILCLLKTALNGYNDMKKAAAYFHKTGKNVHHFIAIDLFCSFVDLLEELTNEMNKIRL